MQRSGQRRKQDNLASMTVIGDESQSLTSGLRRLLTHLSPPRRRQLAGLSVLMIVGAVAELATLSAVLPFLAVLADPGLSSKYPQLQQLFAMLGWRGEGSILLPATLLFAVVALGAAAIRMLLSWVSIKFSFGVGADIGVEVYRRTLHQPYKFHIARNTSEIIAGLSKSQLIAREVINPLLQGALSLLLSLAILGALIRIDPVTALTVSLGFGAIYLVVTLATRHRLAANSRIFAVNETRRVQAVQEGLGAIRDILMEGTQNVYVDRFWTTDSAVRHAQTVNSFIGTVPRYLIESLGMVLIAALAYWLSLGQEGLPGAAPVLGALALGAQKLMPQVQQIYNSWAMLRGNRSILANVIALLEQPIPDDYSNPSPDCPMHLEHGIVLHDVSFRYRNDGPEVVRQLNLQIPRGSRVGFIGKTGTGKSTVIDLITGLLEPTSGYVEIDGRPLASCNRRAWQSRIAHVPQSIYLADSSIAQNIAFGLDARDIDQQRVREAARTAQLAEFIETLPRQYQTAVGERGIRLSGGQRQRIGLARALYKQADVLVLDEATSALDDTTEKAVAQAIDSLGKGITVLIIAHRVTTLRNCDRIFELKNGSLYREGSYQEVIRLAA
jgi:ABC-type multidrug transport system fused ATPase/permease subunit